MKQQLLLILIALIIISCKEDDSASPELLGTWQLTEVQESFGGRADFEPVNSDKTITFLEDGRVISNASLCNFANNSGTVSAGVYSIQDSIIVLRCPDVQITSNIWFKVEDGNLILSYQCFEACAEKYVKL